ncbi:MAG: response regulator transcription factor [Opitutaceae bacterium]|nr:response regulator transcription factor [Opitutaceae bacterium]
MDRVLIVKWDCLYARFLSEAVHEFYPGAFTETVFTSEAARQCLARHSYDLVIAGLSFSDGDGLPLLNSMAQASGVHGLLLVTLRKDAEMLALLRQFRRISVFDPVRDAPERFALALAHVAQDRRYLSPAFHELLMSSDGAHHLLYAQMTDTERMVLSVIGDGSDDKSAGERLGLEPASVHAHRKRLMRKLGVQTRDMLFRRALELGIVRILPDGRTARPSFDVLKPQIESRKRQLATRRSMSCKLRKDAVMLAAEAGA